MAQNIIILNEDATELTVHEAPFRFQTTTRPILIRHQYSPSGSSPEPVLVQLDVLVEKNGTWTKVGATQITGKDFESTATETYFTFDISSILHSQVSSGFYSSMFPSSGFQHYHMVNDSLNQDFSSVIKFKTESRSWYKDSLGNVVLNTEDAAIESKTKRAYSAYFKPELLSPNKYANTPTSSRFASLISTASTKLNNRKFLTNCPSSLSRKVVFGNPLVFSMLFMERVTNPEPQVNIFPRFRIAFSVNGNNDFSENTDDFDYTPNVFPNHASFDTPDDTRGVGDIHVYETSFTQNNLLATLLGHSAVSSVGDLDPKIKAYIDGTESSVVVDSTKNVEGSYLSFELLGTQDDNGDTFTKLNRPKKDICTIYFVNDFNCLDFFCFDAGLDIVHEHSKNSFTKGFKDYTSRESSNFGVSRGSTIEVYTCRTLVNKEASEFLSEIYRSKEVYMYDSENSNFIPILVLDGESQTCYSDPKEIQPFTISFVKDTHVIKN